MPAPIKEHIEGEDDPVTQLPPWPKRSIDREIENIDATKLLGAIEASTRWTAYLKAGFGQRAVVVPKDLSGEELHNPNRWGIVCRVEPMKPHPLYVKFVDGQSTWMTMEMLDLVWAMMTLEEMKSYRAQMRQ